MKIIRLAALAAAAALIAAPAAAHAASDAPVPYVVGADGILLPKGDAFADGGHVNVRTNQGARGIHFEDRNWPLDDPRRAYIGERFIPWTAFGYDVDTLCVEWVQLSHRPEHFGEGDQPPVGNGCATPTPRPSEPAEPTPEPTVTPEPTPTVTPTPTPTPDDYTPTVPTPTTTIDAPPAPDEPSQPETPATRIAATGADAIALYGAAGAGLLAIIAGIIVAMLTARKPR